MARTRRPRTAGRRRTDDDARARAELHAIRTTRVHIGRARLPRREDRPPDARIGEHPQRRQIDRGLGQPQALGGAPECGSRSPGGPSAPRSGGRRGRRAAGSRGGRPGPSRCVGSGARRCPCLPPVRTSGSDHGRRRRTRPGSSGAASAIQPASVGPRSNDIRASEPRSALGRYVSDSMRAFQSWNGAAVGLLKDTPGERVEPGGLVEVAVDDQSAARHPRRAPGVERRTSRTARKGTKRRRARPRLRACRDERRWPAVRGRRRWSVVPAAAPARGPAAPP